MDWNQVPLGPIQTNCYVLQNDVKEGLIIDPGDEVDKIVNMINQDQITPIGILLTHAHFDHIGAIDDLRDVWSVPVYLHHIEKDWLYDPHKNGSGHFPMIDDMIRRPAEELLKGETALSIGHFNCHVIETPGHSPGSVSFYFPENSVVFSGDALMNGSIGRTDLFGGDMDQLMASIQDKLMTLPEETIVSPGHGFETTVGQEKATNPFL